MAAVTTHGFETPATSTPDVASPTIERMLSRDDCFKRVSMDLPLIKITDKALNAFHAVAIPHFLQRKNGKVCGMVISGKWTPQFDTECNQEQSALINKVIFQKFSSQERVTHATPDLFALARNKYITLKRGSISRFLEIMALAPANAIFHIAEIKPHPGEKFKATDPSFINLQKSLPEGVIADKHIIKASDKSEDSD